MSARERTLGARLGLLALLLIALAPLLSQSRAEPRDWRWLAELACHQGPSAALPSPAGPVLQVDACGYCSLLSHSPALADHGWPHLAAIATVGTTRTSPPTAPSAAPHFPRALSRAPPRAA